MLIAIFIHIATALVVKAIASLKAPSPNFCTPCHSCSLEIAYPCDWDLGRNKLDSMALVFFLGKYVSAIVTT